MILIIGCFLTALIFLAISYKYVNSELYDKYSTIFFLLNSAAFMMIMITGAYLFTFFLLTGELNIIGELHV